jgi:hypothetical protein
LIVVSVRMIHGQQKSAWSSAGVMNHDVVELVNSEHGDTAHVVPVCCAALGRLPNQRA